MIRTPPRGPDPMTDETTLHIACTFDERMVMPAFALLASVRRFHPTTRVHAHLMHAPGLNAEIDQIVAALAGPLFAFTLYEASTDYGHLSAMSHYSKANFYRVDLMTKIEHAERCLYLDCDIIVTRDLMELYRTDMGGHVTAASTDYLVRYYMSELDRKVPFRGRNYTTAEYLDEVLTLKGGKYLNSGVMVVDLARWNAERVSERVMDYCLARPGLTMVDQDGINAVLDGRYAEIDCRWNATVYMRTVYEKTRKTPSAAWAKIIALWTDDPWIVHFTFESKPWEPGHHKTAYDDVFWDYMMGSPFAKAFIALYREKIKRRGFFKRLRAKKIPERYQRA